MTASQNTVESGIWGLVGDSDSEALTAIFYKKQKLPPRGESLYQQLLFADSSLDQYFLQYNKTNSTST